jgi:hypothetical protein
MRARIPISGICVSISLAISSQVHAQEPAAARKEARAVRVEGRAPVLDGRLDDAVWSAATPISDFTQKEPAEGAAATERTEVRFAYDDAALWVGARMHSADPAKIQAPVSRRDVVQQSEYVQVFIDSYHDRRTAYTFGVTAAGTRVDRYHARDNQDADDTFSPVWEARVARDSAGWTAEMRIPLSQLRFSPGSAQTWGVNVQRWIPSKEESVFWVMVPRSVSSFVSRFGDLAGIEGVRPARRIELSPYVATGAAFTAGVDPRDPFTEPREMQLRAGADVKVGLGPNLTLDATVNPDFGQVDADPAEVNLSAFETFFAERRPFFTEGSALLAGGGGGYFYSRRIGGPPRGAAGGDFVDRPQATTILGAAKLTGRLPSGLSVGVLAAVTGRERALTFDTATGERATVEVEPPAGYGVARLQQEFGPAGSTVGMTLTGVGRDLDEGSPLAARFGSAAVTGGVDWNLRFQGGTYEVNGALGMSRVAGDSLAILRLQRASARYFQRPDAEYVRVDPSRTALSGYFASLSAARVSGKHWLWQTGVSAESPGFELNDVGSLSTADEIGAYAQLRYRETTPRGALRRWDVYLTPEATWNFGGARAGATWWADAELTWKNFWRSVLTGFYVPRGESPTLTRGGPLAGTLSAWGVIGSLASSSSSRLRWNGRVYYSRNEEGRPTYRLSGGLSVRPGPRWQLSVEPNYLRSTPMRQFVSVADGGPAETFGKTYTFAAIVRTEFFADVRLNYLFTPDLSLEFYAQPFASAGRYFDFGTLPAAGSHELTYLDPQPSGDGYDFNVRSLRSNAVLRWEWRPGSTLFVVWQQDREGERDRIATVTPRSLLETLDAPGNNYLAVKVSYWLPLR